MKITAAGQEYSFPEKLTMGELRLLKKHFDLARPAEFDKNDIDHIAGVVFIAMRRQQPNLSIADAVEKIDALDHIEFEAEPGDDGYEPQPGDGAEADPTSAGDAEPSS